MPSSFPRTACATAALCLLLACSEAPETQRTPRPEEGAAAAPDTAPRSPAPDDGRLLVVFLGDSLTAGLGLEEEQAHPAWVEERLVAAGWPVRVVNAGVSGDTTAGGLRRLDWLLRQRPDVMVVSLGANDGLRGLELGQTEENLRRIIVRSREAGVRVLLSGMLMPPNYGPDYAERFREIYPRLAAELEVPLIPFLLEGVAAHPELNLPDGIHPNAEGQRRVAETVAAHLEPLLAEVLAGGGGAASPE